MDNISQPGVTKKGEAHKVRPGTWLLLKIRQWHGWLGMAMSLLIAMVCLSGIYLNHKDWFDRRFRPTIVQGPVAQYASLWGKLIGSDIGTEPSPSVRFFGPLSTSSSAAVLQPILERALREARSRWGDRELEKLELKPENGTLVCKLTSTEKEQLALELSTGAVVAKGGKPEKGPKPEKRENFGKWVKNLHTGKIGGMTGKLVVDFTSLSILALTLSGLYLWAWPRLRRKVKSATL